MPFPSPVVFPSPVTFKSPVSFLTNVFLFDGDSLSRGVGATDPTASNLHTLMSAEPRFAGKAKFFSVAVGGRSVAQMVTDYPATKPYRTGPGHSYLFIWGGQAGFSATTITELQTYWALARADGYKVVANTITPNATDDVPTKALRDATNVTIRASSSQWDYLIDNAVLLPDPFNALYFSDAVHLTTLGYQTVANSINSLLSLPVL
jgi:hypothetical protein